MKKNKYNNYVATGILWRIKGFVNLYLIYMLFSL